MLNMHIFLVGMAGAGKTSLGRRLAANLNLPFVDTEWELLLFVTAPFNLLKGFIIGLITWLIYKPLSPILHVKK